MITSGPTFFSPILQKAGFIAGEAHGLYMKDVKEGKLNVKPQYHVLLMITDGVIDDMKQTIDIIVKIANTKVPLSVIIIGVGNADLTKMQVLDADDEPLIDSNGQAAYRDIVQFIPFNKVAASNDMSLLAKETLAEIPAQFMSYVDAHDIEPLSKAKPKYNANKYDYNEDSKSEEQELEVQAVDYNIQTDPWLNAPVPPGWTREYTEDGKPYYVDDTAGKTQWDHPAAVAFMKKIKEKEQADNTGSNESKAKNAFGGGDDWANFDSNFDNFATGNEFKF